MHNTLRYTVVFIDSWLSTSAIVDVRFEGTISFNVVLSMCHYEGGSMYSNNMGRKSDTQKQYKRKATHIVVSIEGCRSECDPYRLGDHPCSQSTEEKLWGH